MLPIFTPLLAATSLLVQPVHLHAIRLPNATIKSPSLEAIDGRQVVVTLPAHWTVIQRDDKSLWTTPVNSFDGQGSANVSEARYSFTARNGSGKAAVTRKIDVLVDTFGPGSLNSSYQGARQLTTNSGLKGIVKAGSGDATTQDWYLTILPKSPTAKGVVKVCIHFKNVSVPKQRVFADFVFRHFRIEK